MSLDTEKACQNPDQPSYIDEHTITLVTDNHIFKISFVKSFMRLSVIKYQSINNSY